MNLECIMLYVSCHGDGAGLKGYGCLLPIVSLLHSHPYI